MSREQDILRAAERLFWERSFDGVGVDAIGKEAGITGSAIYRHFEGKDQILEALFDEAVDAVLLRAGQPADDPREELERLVNAHVGFALDHYRLAGIWSREQRALHGPAVRSFKRRTQRYTSRWIKCLDACYPGHTTDELLSAVRAAHALITSDATTRPPMYRQSAHLHELLPRLALAALDGLAVPVGSGPLLSS